MRRPRAWIALVTVLGALTVTAGASAPKHQDPSAQDFRKQLRRERAVNHRLSKAIRNVPALTAPERHLLSIAACESGGNPRAISPGGKYRGRYQFDLGTWAGVGGSGDPAAATVTEQNWRALLLYQRRGAAPWPVCRFA